MFKPSNILLEFLNEKPYDIYNIVGALEGYINADSRFETDNFDQAINYVLNHGISEKELFEDFNPNYKFEEDSNKWDYDYYCLARVYLRENFCKKRINHVKAIAKKIFPESTNESLNSKENDTGGQQIPTKKSRDQSVKRTTLNRRHVAITVLILLGAVLVILIAFIMKQK